MGAFWLVFPSVFMDEIKSPWWLLLFAFVPSQARESIIEWLFHRWFLHAPLIPGMTAMWKAHTLHHRLTEFKIINLRSGTGKVFSRYPIIEERQNVSSFFPDWSLAAFIGFALIATAIPIKLIFPGFPIISMTILSVTWSIFFYEIVHAIEHWPFETFWLPKLEGRFGWFWKKAYFFHLWHHRDIKVNEGISGFICGIPLADWLMRTYVACSFDKIPAHGQRMSESEFEHPAPKPWGWILWLDDIAAKRAAKLKALGLV